MEQVVEVVIMVVEVLRVVVAVEVLATPCTLSPALQGLT